MPHVLIAGAGPVGLTLAAELARYGVDVRIVDRSPRPTQTSKALVIWARTLELMDRMGCTPAFLEAGLRAHAVAMHHGRATLGKARLDGIPSHYNYALMIPQRDTERLLGAHLGSFGVTVERQVELRHFDATADRVEALLRHADGREERVAAPWLVGCDGAHSTVRTGLGAAFHGIAEDDDWMLADVRLDGADAPPGDAISIYFHHEGPFVIFPMPGGRARVIATVGKTDPAHPRPEPDLAGVQAMIDGRAGGGFRATDPAWLANFHINERKVDEYRHGRVFLAGDAAHIHSPAGGQGMNTGMQDAINLAWKLALVIQGGAAESLLDSYSPERGAVGDMVLRNATRLTDMATLEHAASQTARNLALRALLGLHLIEGRVATVMSEVAIAYDASPLSVGPKAGERLAPEHYAGPPPGAGSMPRFVLYAADTERARACTRAHPSLLEAAPRTPTHPGGLTIVRPDGYVGLAAAADGWDEAERYLARLAPATGPAATPASA